MKRFYKEACVGEVEGGFSILLDSRSVKTPSKSLLKVASKKLAEAMADEWNAQVEKVDPDAMPLNRHANTAIDRIHEHRATVVAEISGFGATDLLCYRAHYPTDLIAAQSAGWDPVLAWLDQAHGIQLNVAHGVVVVDQSAENLEAIKALVERYDDVSLAALHTVTNITGSVVLALALFEGAIDTHQTWALSRLEEDHQTRQWGEDAEAMHVAMRREQALLSADRFYRLHMDSN